MNKKLNRISNRINKRIRKNTLLNKTKYNKLNKVAGKTIQLYNFDELSEEAKKKALEEYQYYYWQHYCSDYIDDALNLKYDSCVTDKIKELGLSIDSIKYIYWEHSGAWIVGETSIGEFIESSKINVSLDNEEERELFDYMTDVYEFDFEIDKTGIKYLKEDCENYYLYELDKDSAKPYENTINKVVNIIKDIYKQFVDKVEKVNEYLKDIVRYYLYPSDEYLEDLINEDDYFYENGRYYG